MMEDNHSYVVFWNCDHGGYETYETHAEAVAAMAEFSEIFPWNTYYLAKIVGSQPATKENPKDPYWSGLTVTGGTDPGDVCEVIINGGIMLHRIFTG